MFALNICNKTILTFIHTSKSNVHVVYYTGSNELFEMQLETCMQCNFRGLIKHFKCMQFFKLGDGSSVYWIKFTVRHTKQSCVESGTCMLCEIRPQLIVKPLFLSFS